MPAEGALEGRVGVRGVAVLGLEDGDAVLGHIFRHHNLHSRLAAAAAAASAKAQLNARQPLQQRRHGVETEFVGIGQQLAERNY